MQVSDGRRCPVSAVAKLEFLFSCIDDSKNKITVRGPYAILPALISAAQRNLNQYSLCLDWHRTQKRHAKKKVFGE
jgi:hypothetical protein